MEHQKQNWFNVFPNFCLVLACGSLLLLLRSLLLTYGTCVRFSNRPQFLAIYIRNDVLLSVGWAVLCALFFLTCKHLKQTKKSALFLIYLANAAIPLLLILYTVQTNNLYYELLEQGFYEQHYEALGSLHLSYENLYDAQWIKNKLQQDAVIRSVRMGFLFLLCAIPLTMNSIYFTRRKAYLQGGAGGE